jgi:predicted Zn-dependent protease
MTRSYTRSITARLSRLMVLLLGLGLAPLVVAQARQSPLPEMSDSSAAVLTPQIEREMGEALMRQLRAQGMLHDDLLITSYIESLGNRLASNSGLAAGSITFFVVRDRAINAFAAPGGVIGIHTGLILASQSESELAAVMAHELAHVSQRHMARTYEIAGKMQIANAVALLAAILLGQVDGELGQAAVAATLGGSAQTQINFIRSNEEEADRIGIRILAESGQDPFGMPSFFGRLQRNQRLYGDVLPEFLRTHPVNISRIASATDRASQMPLAKPRDESAYHLARLRLEALDGLPNDQQIDQFELRVRRGDEMARYALALAQLERGASREAMATLAPLLEKEPDRPEFIVLQAEALAASGDLDGAAAEYRNALLVYPGHRALTEGFASLLLAGGQPAEAQALLVAEITTGNHHRTYYRLLNDTAVALNDEVTARRARAEVLLIDGRLSEAAEELRKALRVADAYDSARIAARLNQIEERLDAIAKIEQEK